MRQFNISVEVIREGQPRPYADSEYEYKIKVENYNEFMVKQFCTKVLKPCVQTREEWDVKDADSYFRGCYTFSKVGENEYKYYVNQPFCD